MARKAKGSGFKMKSGNKTTFKQMGSSPVLQQADASLVAAARAAAMANVPKDLSAQYNKTAEGVIAAQKGKTEMLTKAAQEAPGVLTAAYRGIDKAVGKWKAGKGLKGQEKVDAQKAWAENYQEEHKDRKSISDIREMTGAAPKTKKKEEKTPSYKKQLKERKAKIDYEKLIKAEQSRANEEELARMKHEAAISTEGKDVLDATWDGKNQKSLMSDEETDKDLELYHGVTDVGGEDAESDAGGGAEEDAGEDAGEDDPGGGDAGGGDAGGGDSPAEMKRSFYKMKYNNKSFPFKK